MYLSKESHSASDDMTATHTTVRPLTCRVEDLGHKPFMDNFFSEGHKLNSCGMVWPNKKDMPLDQKN
jgi:hypothetical protein